MSTIIPLLRSRIVALHGSRRRILVRHGVAIIRPDIVKPQSVLVHLRTHIDPFTTQLCLKHVLRKHALAHVRPVEAVHTIRPDDTTLTLDNRAARLHGAAEAVDIASDFLQELADVFKLHSAADGVEVEPLERDLLALWELLVHLGNIVGVCVTHDGLGVVLVDEIHKVERAVRSAEEIKVFPHRGEIGVL